VVILLALSFIPYAGLVVAFAAVCFGLGALTLSAIRNRAQSSSLPPVTPAPERHGPSSAVVYGPAGGTQTPA
jgi:hypothetical protein